MCPVNFHTNDDVQNPLKLILKVVRVQVAYSYTYELRPYLDLLLQILLIEDSWQTHRSDSLSAIKLQFCTVFLIFFLTLFCRIHNVLKGIPDDRDGLFDTIQRSKNHYQKRAYQCIKCMVALFSNCSVAYQILQVRSACSHQLIIRVITVLFVIKMFKLNHIEKSTTCLMVCTLLSTQSNGDLKRKWTWAVEWLGDELERRPYTGNPQYTYNNWSPPVQSNETSNGYFLERSHSARMTLAKACELCPEEVMTSYPLTHSRTRLANIIVIAIF